MNSKISCITIGNEILRGFRVDSNFYHLAKKLGELGEGIEIHVTTKDSKESIKNALSFCTKETDIIFTIGGLGPTIDDVTRESISEFLDIELVFREDIFYDLKKREPLLSESEHRKYGLFPKGAKIFINEVGLAHSFLVEKEGKKIFSLPGPKNEFEHTLEKILKEFEPKKDYKVIYLDLPFKKEIEIQDTLKEKINLNLLFFLPYTGGVILGIKGKIDEVSKAKKLIYNVFGDDISSEGPLLLEEVVGRLLKEKKKKISTAESCTGGLLSSRITDIPGSSEYFIGGVIAYSNEIKKNILGVKEEDLKSYGAVSEPVVRKMAESIRKMFCTDFGLSISGIAGPTGGSEEKPVGTVYLAISYDKETLVFKKLFKGKREEIKFKSTHFILNELRKLLIKV
ncbi:MAG: nicotinamide-nucleotide amidohydrolase family protein [Candidatus Hydrothermales bacterium]